MTDHANAHPAPTGGHTDMREHLRTWHGFTTLIKWGIVANIALLIFLAVFRTH